MSAEDNTTPIVAQPIADQYVVGGASTSFAVGATFYDPDPDDQLVYSAALEDGSPFPAWLIFNPAFMSFTLSPDIDVSGVASVRLFATDGSGAQASDLFDIFVFAPNLTIYGTSGDDLLQGGAGNDELHGLEGNDTLHGRAGADYLDGGTGNDVLDGGAGSDTYFFGIGSDTDTIVNGDPNPAQSWDIVAVTGTVSLADVQFELIGHDPSMRIISSGDRLIFSGLATSADGDQIDEVQFFDGTRASVLLGTSQDDFLLANAGTSILAGFEGDDVLSGWSGADIYIYTANGGFDRIDDFAEPGSGNELWFVGVGSAQGISLSRYGTVMLDGEAVVQIDGFNRDDVAGSNIIQTFRFDDGSVMSYQDLLARGIDIFAPPGGGVQYFGTNVRDRFHGSEDFDMFGGGAGDDLLYGFGGNDILGGDDGDDYLEGGDGSDALDGGAGNDTLNGGAGDDALLGGIGSDTYLFDRSGGYDEIFDIQSSPGDIDTLIFGDDIAVQDLTVTLDAYGILDIAIGGANASIRVNAWSSQSPPPVERFLFQDGTVLSGAQINAMLDVNEAPQVAHPIADQTAQDEVPFRYVVPQNAFSDPNENDELTYAARLVNGNPLPAWLSFDPRTRTFEGTPPPSATGFVNVRVIATDRFGLSASDDFLVKVRYDGMITGTPGPDNIQGTAVNDVVFALEGDDSVFAGEGDDTLFGGGGADALNGGAGKDTLDGGAGNDVLDGGIGFDTMQGGLGDDTYIIADTMGGPTSLTLYNLLVGQTTFYNADMGMFTPTLFDRNEDGQIDYVRFLYREVETPADHWFMVDVSTSQLGTNLAPGTYLDAQRASFASPGHPGLDLAVDGNGFNTLTGSFTVAEAEFDYSGPVPILLALSVDFEIFSTITGTLNYNHAAAGPSVYDAVNENAGEGIDTVTARYSYALPVNVENLTLTGTANTNGSGNELDNVLTGNSGDNILLGAAGSDILSGGAGRDVLDGGAGYDLLQGGTGDDTYLIDGADADAVVENALAGVDAVVSSVSYALTPNAEILTLTGNANLNGTGNGLGNLLNGNAGANFLEGGGGSDRLLGGAGNDLLDGGADLDTLQGGTGDDTYVISDIVTLGGSTSLAMRSEPGDYIGIGQTYAFNADSGAFTPSLSDRNQDGKVDYVEIMYRSIGSPFGDFFVLDFSTAGLGSGITPGLYSDAQRAAFAAPGHPGLDVFGNGRGSNQVFGSFTIGAVDIDTSGPAPVLKYLSVDFEQHSENPARPALFGTLVYNIEPAAATAMDAVIENAGEGNDTVMSALSYVLGPNVENLVLTGSANIDGTGNGLDNVLTGNSGSNRLSGGAGNDIMSGGLGNDMYVVDSASDVVKENAGEGSDLVQSSVTYALAANVENLTLTGMGAINGTGNNLGNVIEGNSAANVLAGGAGDDTYLIDGTDTVIELADQGTDTVRVAQTHTLAANVENLTLIGNAAISGGGNALDNVIIGTGAANVLRGFAGNDWLDGGAGADVLVGDAGDDTFVVDNVADVVVSERPGEGTDTVLASVNYALADNIENLTLLGSAIMATGNNQANVLTGNALANMLTGGLGNDIYVIDATDTVVEDANAGTDTVRTSETYTLAANVENLELTGAAAINGTGNTRDNVIVGNAAVNVLTGLEGNDWLDGGAGADVLQGGAGDDIYIVGAGDVVMENAGEGSDLVESSLSWILAANLENLTLTGAAAIDGAGNMEDNVLTGNGARNTLTGEAGNDTLDGGSGADTLIGGLGDDTYFVDSTGDVVTENAGAGIDTVTASVTYTLAANFENLGLAGASAINGTGNSLDNVLIGNTAANVLTGLGGNDSFDGDTGADTMIGGTGDDSYIVDDAGDRVVENASEGIDAVYSWISYTLAANVEYLTLIADATDATGNTLNNYLTGNYLGNVLNGGLGADVLFGQQGDDTYVVDNAGDVVFESSGEGTDLVQSSITYALTENVENLMLTGASAIRGTGNALDNILTGNSGNNTLTGGAGNDTLNGGGGNDTMIGGTGNDLYVVDSASDVITESTNGGTDTVQTSVSITALASNVENVTLTGIAALNATGNSLANVLTGNSGSNVLSGGAGNDAMIGGLGNDTYVVDSANDVATEIAGEGTDLVQSSVTYALAANVENLTLTGTASINATGNDLDNILNGNSGNNTLTGGAGNDTLIGGGGTDVMIGGAGNDTYTVDGASDVVTELAGEGIDLIQSSVSLTTLAANVENLTLTGTNAINGTGNALDNIITGNAGNNTLRGNGGNDTLIGLAGNDTMIGGTGDDIYVLDSTSDVVTENASEGADTIRSSVAWTLATNFENLILTGSAAINGTGNAAANLLVGTSGVNTLAGAAGNDILQGLGGNDILTDSAGAGLLDGGSGNDALTGNSSSQMFIGGLGNDTITTGTGADIIAFNSGSGQDVINASTGADNTLSLGGGIAYDNLTFSRSGSNLVLNAGGTDKLTLAGWYAGNSNKSVARLQIFTEAMSGYDQGSSNPLLDDKVEQFNFTALASAFDAAGQVNGWALTNALLSTHLSGSDTAAIGGDLAYQYGKGAPLTGIGLAPAQDVINSAQFGSSAQTLRTLGELQQGPIRLS